MEMLGGVSWARVGATVTCLGSQLTCVLATFCTCIVCFTLAALVRRGLRWHRAVGRAALYSRLVASLPAEVFVGQLLGHVANSVIRV